MKVIAPPSIYDLELKFEPYGFLIREITEKIVIDAPRNGSVLDLMCGPGHILRGIAEKRQDLQLEGVDISETFISEAREKDQTIDFYVEDVRTWGPNKTYDLILCTAGVHHLRYEEQEPFLSGLPSLLNQQGTFIMGDLFIPDYDDERQRKRAAARFGGEYLRDAIVSGAPVEVIKACIDIMYNDVLGFEYKTSAKKMYEQLSKFFNCPPLSIGDTPSSRWVWNLGGPLFPEVTFGIGYFVCTTTQTQTAAHTSAAQQ